MREDASEFVILKGGTTVSQSILSRSIARILARLGNLLSDLLFGGIIKDPLPMLSKHEERQNAQGGYTPLLFVNHLHTLLERMSSSTAGGIVLLWLGISDD